jgi:hypothetical protein
MLRVTSRIANIMAAEQQKRNIVIIGTYWPEKPPSFDAADFVQVAVLSAARQHTFSHITQSSIAKETQSPS